MKVFVTGHKGYIGPHLVSLLKAEKHWVTGCDLGVFEECAWESLPVPDEDIKADFREVRSEDLIGFDCVMHLAAISNDPMGELNPEVTLAINRDGSIDLARKARKAGVSRFLFSSSCSIYGHGVSEELDEDAPLNPLTAYARSKIEAEAGIRELASNSFTPIFLRNATAYGYSPNYRNDLVVNNLLSCAWFLDVFSGTLRRGC